jgi:hypothetical protein
VGDRQRLSQPRRDALRAGSQPPQAGASQLESRPGCLPPHRRPQIRPGAHFVVFLADHPEIPAPKRNVYIDGWEIDCYWPQYQLAVELDGRPYHIAVRDMENDRFKDGKLLIIGIRTLRITDTRFNHDSAEVHEDLISLMKR